MTRSSRNANLHSSVHLFRPSLSRAFSLHNFGSDLSAVPQLSFISLIHFIYLKANFVMWRIAFRDSWDNQLCCLFWWMLFIRENWLNDDNCNGRMMDLLKSQTFQQKSACQPFCENLDWCCSSEYWLRKSHLKLINEDSFLLTSHHFQFFVTVTFPCISGII